MVALMPFASASKERYPALIVGDVRDSPLGEDAQSVRSRFISQVFHTEQGRNTVAALQNSSAKLVAREVTGALSVFVWQSVVIEPEDEAGRRWLQIDDASSNQELVRRFIENAQYFGIWRTETLTISKFVTEGQRRFRATVECEVFDVLRAAINEVYDLDEYLDQYFRSLPIIDTALVPAGGSLAEHGRPGDSIRREFFDSPPSQPGISFSLSSVEELQSGVGSLLAGHGDTGATGRRRRRREGDETSPSDSNQSQGLNLVDVSIWVSGDDGREVREALERYLGSQGVVSVVTEGPIIRGSWKQSIAYHLLKNNRRGIADSADMSTAAVLALTTDSIREEAQNLRLKAEAWARLIEAVKDQDEAVIIFGSTVIIKVVGAVMVREIDPITAQMIRTMPELATNPTAMIEQLNKIQGPQHPPSTHAATSSSRWAGDTLS